MWCELDEKHCLNASKRERNLLFKNNKKTNVLYSMLEDPAYVESFIYDARSWVDVYFSDNNVNKMLGSNSDEEVWLPYFTHSYPERWKQVLRVLKLSMPIASNDHGDNSLQITAGQLKKQYGFGDGDGDRALLKKLCCAASYIISKQELEEIEVSVRAKNIKKQPNHYARAKLMRDYFDRVLGIVENFNNKLHSPAEEKHQTEQQCSIV